jgi:hypothetical protein
VIYDWLAECIGNHANCSEIGSYLPTRVIEVGSADGFSRFSARLVHSQELQGRAVGYTALSHCWGSVRRPVMTTKENLTLHLRGLDLNLLPKTYRDAITITRKLNIQYLWIDSLCIIQDDTTDWEREAANMALVYGHAYLTIAAASATDSTGGCYIDDVIQSTNLQIKIDHPKGMQTNVYIRCPAYRPNTFYESPLHQRGWVLQEVILSRRTLYFTQDQMFWQCNSGQYAEDGLEVGDGGFKIHVDNLESKKIQFGRLEHPSWSHWGSLISRDPGNLAIYDLSTPMAAFNTWWRWVADYRSRRLTEVNDRFAALAGIVKHYQTRTNDKPLAGLWERDLKHHLLWAFQEPSREEVKYKSLVGSGISWRAPSWSWFAIDGIPIYPPQLSLQEQDSNDITKPGMQFLRSEILWSGEPLTSSLIKAALHLRGLIREMTLHQLRNARLPGEEVIPGVPKYTNSLICSVGEQPLDRPRQDDSLNSPFPLDYRSEAHFDHHDPKRKTVLCLLVAKSETEEKMLMIEPTGNAANEYRRVGIATHTHEGWGYEYCYKHECKSDECERLGFCTGPRRLFMYNNCFQGLKEMVISLV